MEAGFGVRFYVDLQQQAALRRGTHPTVRCGLCRFLGRRGQCLGVPSKTQRHSQAA
jgi:hypothetical protein